MSRLGNKYLILYVFVTPLLIWSTDWIIAPEKLGYLLLNILSTTKNISSVEKFVRGANVVVVLVVVVVVVCGKF